MQELKLPSPEGKLLTRSIVSNLLVAALSTGLIVWSLQALRTRLTSVVSIDAVVNGTIIDIKAPQEGVVSELTVTTGDDAASGQSLLTLQAEQTNELQIQEIANRLNQRQTDLQRAQNRLEQLTSLLQMSQVDNQAQFFLENQEAESSMNQVAADLQGAEARLDLAQISYERARQLQAAGALSMADLDSATVEVEQRQAEVDSLNKHLNRLQANKQAAELGLVINQTRSNYDPRIRVQELQLQVSDKQQLIQSLTQVVQATEAELSQTKLDAERQQTAQIKASADGVIWSLAVQPGTFVQRGESIGKLLKCSRRWIDAVVDERTLKSLQIGTPATIDLYGDDSITLRGSVGMIRSGLGRLSPGEDMAIPITANTPRNAQIRIDIDPDSNPGGDGQMCYVGYTGKVTFDIR